MATDRSAHGVVTPTTRRQPRPGGRHAARESDDVFVLERGEAAAAALLSVCMRMLSTVRGTGSPFAVKTPNFKRSDI